MALTKKDKIQKNNALLAKESVEFDILLRKINLVVAELKDMK
jgi:hypothetical protein